MKTIMHYVDVKNRELYLKLIEKYQIELIHLEPTGTSLDDKWQLNNVQGVFRISRYKDIDKSNFFTHELLHIDLIDKGFSDFSEILPLIREGNKNYIFTPIIGHINNILAHEKFYCDFIKMGYLPSEFVSDYYELLNSQKSISEIENATGLPFANISLFIQYYFTIKDNRNPTNENAVNEILTYLKEKNSKLLSILDNTWLSWQNSQSLSSKDFLSHLFEQTELLLEVK